ncbi:MAG TPA: CRISPR-associated endoribonuclease Cas6 [Clostridiaceae bacterium]|jgi:CRISPR-associated endoribonuclease Cas6|nr:CRISPR-associated endoribonuclease Cas6 [Clostridiaceae bacterium]HBF78057.1 CRISPR-associated endoribonuclease Cas6 [Clostridiaceae bacterium]HBG39703.1 CRISPR-associated endoribonuclease Cas6 [Clostridiaceae bacterium]
MRAYITLEFKNLLVLPIHYNHIVQAVILKWIGDENYSKFIHDGGYTYNKRNYKMYTFSRLQGKFSFDRINKTISYLSPANLVLSTADDKFLEYVVNNVISKDSFRIGNNEVYVKEIRCVSNDIEGKNVVYTKSPIVVYSTVEINGRKKTYYYNPKEKEFEELIRNNLINKYNALYNEKPLDDEFHIKAIDNFRLKENIDLYKGIVIKGWTGEFEIDGAKKLLNLAYDTGLGSKNSQGFGCIEIKAQ